MSKAIVTIAIWFFITGLCSENKAYWWMIWVALLATVAIYATGPILSVATK